MDDPAADDVVLLVLDHDGGRRLSVEAEVEHGAGVSEGEAQAARLDLVGHRLLAAAVDDAGDKAGAAQTAGFAGIGDLPVLRLERGGVVVGHGEQEG